MTNTRLKSAPVDHPATVELRVLGGFAVIADGQALSDRAWGGSRKARSLAKLLTLAQGQRLHRDQILDALWPDLDPDAASPSLHQAIYLMRRALAPLGVEVALQAQVIALRARGELTTDLAAFEVAAAHARRSRERADYEAALARYTGELLPDDRYDEWALHPREAARSAHLDLLRELAALLEARGDRDEAIDAFDRLATAEPADEAAHVALMRLYAQDGQRARALQQFGQLRAALKSAIDAEPEPASQQIYAAILAGHYAEVGSRREPAGVGGEGGSGEERARHNLPAPTTALIGREEAIAAIRRELAGARLVTLLGTGGIGKTRLALAVGHALRADYPGGVWLLDLAALQDGALLVGTLAGVLGVRDRTGQPLREGIIAALRERPTLVLLDNCEHLIAPCAEIAAALLAGCPELRLLATSREALRVAGELTWRVPSLPIPELPAGSASALALSDLAANPAVDLFLDRARFARPGFVLTAENGQAMAEICRRLDGIPLALELAAARVAVLAPQQLADRLDDALRLLTGGPRTALPRHQTLRATLEWSYQFLAASERALLDRLAVFAGGCTLTAAEAVGDLGADTLDLLAALVDRSLVQVELGQGEEEPRYRTLETVRQYAAERLAGRDEGAAVAERHAAWFLRLAEEAGPELLGARQAQWLARLTRDLDNLRAALARYAAHDRVEEQLRLASALERFWSSGNYHHEGLAWLTDGLARVTDATAVSVRAQANLAVAQMMLVRNDPGAAIFANQGVALYREVGNRDKQAECQNLLGLAARYQGDPEQARAHFTQALSLWREDNNLRGVGRAQNSLAAIHGDRDEMVEAVAILEEILPIFRTLNERRMTSFVLGNISLGYASMGRHTEARPLLQESLHLMVAAQDWTSIAFVLVIAALIANGRAEPARAAQLLGASARLHEVLKLPPVSTHQRYAVRAATAATASLGEATYASAYATGHAWSAEESIAQVRAYLTD